MGGRVILNELGANEERNNKKKRRSRNGLKKKKPIKGEGERISFRMLRNEPT